MKNSYVLFLIISIPLISSVVPTQSTENSLVNQHMTPSALPTFFFNPLEYSQKSFTFFLERVYNHHRYPQEFLALNFLHVVSGTALASASNQPRRFIKQMLDLFDQKLMQIYINPYAFADMLTQIIPLISRYTDPEKEKRNTIEGLKQHIGNYLVDHFHELKVDTDATLTNLAQELYALLHNEQKDISVRELQHAVHYFIARGLIHLIWSPSDQLDTWSITKTLSRLLETCTERSLIDGDMLDDLFWILLKRYSYFISLSSSELDASFFEGARHDLLTEQTALWLYPEREAYITTKLEYFQNILIEAEVTARMRATGLIIPNVRP